MTMKVFRRSVISSLTAEAQVASSIKRKSLADKIVQMNKSKAHVDPNARVTERKHQPKRCTKRRCARCSTKAKPSRTTWMCETYGVPLCLRKGKNCFSDYHKKMSEPPYSMVVTRSDYLVYCHYASIFFVCLRE